MQDAFNKIHVIKRDGRIVPFDPEKIRTAVTKANLATEENHRMTDEQVNLVTEDVAYYVTQTKKDRSVENIQDIVEEVLCDENFRVARKYITYRYEHNKKRARYDAVLKKVSDKIKGENKQNQNANVDEGSFGGRKGEAANVVLKDYALNECMCEKSRNNHLDNLIYIHDLDSYALGQHNCLTLPLDHLLKNGFNTRQTDVRPAQSVNTAMQLVAVCFQLQSLQQFGGVAASHLDWTMVPYVRKSFFKHFGDGVVFIDNGEIDEIPNIEELSIDDVWYKEHGSHKAYTYAYKKTSEEVYQAVEALYHNLNTLQSRSGNQLPFSSINFGTCTLAEGRLVIRALLDTTIKGVGKLHRTAVFPCSIFQYMKGVNDRPGTPNYDLYRLALKSTAKRLYPNYANCDWSGNEGYDPNDPKTFFSTMGCRTANGYDINGFGQLKDGRGNICPVTVIMPEIAIRCKEANPDMSESELVSAFMAALDEKISEAKDMLLERFEFICSQSADSAKFMYENGCMAGYIPEEGIRSALKHGTLALGQLGLAETLQILIDCDHTTDKGMALAKRIEGLFKDRCAQYKKQYSLNFGVYLSPAENLAYTAMQKFKEKHGVIPKVSDKEFFTNSIHVPVWKKMGVFKKIDTESQLTGYSSAGCIVYTEFESDIKNNIDALETVVNYAMDKDVPYFAVNVPNVTCMDCGYTGDFDGACPKCGGEHILKLARVTGYLSNDYRDFNKGKQQETEMRVKHSQNGERYEVQRRTL